MMNLPPGFEDTISRSRREKRVRPSADAEGRGERRFLETPFGGRVNEGHVTTTSSFPLFGRGSDGIDRSRARPATDRSSFDYPHQQHLRLGGGGTGGRHPPSYAHNLDSQHRNSQYQTHHHHHHQYHPHNSVGFSRRTTASGTTTTGAAPERTRWTAANASPKTNGGSSSSFLDPVKVRNLFNIQTDRAPPPEDSSRSFVGIDKSGGVQSSTSVSPPERDAGIRRGARAPSNGGWDPLMSHFSFAPSGSASNAAGIKSTPVAAFGGGLLGTRAKESRLFGGGTMFKGDSARASSKLPSYREGGVEVTTTATTTATATNITTSSTTNADAVPSAMSNYEDRRNQQSRLSSSASPSSPSYLSAENERVHNRPVRSVSDSKLHASSLHNRATAQPTITEKKLPRSTSGHADAVQNTSAVVARHRAPQRKRNEKAGDDASSNAPKVKSYRSALGRRQNSASQKQHGRPQHLSNRAGKTNGVLSGGDAGRRLQKIKPNKKKKQASSNLATTNVKSRNRTTKNDDQGGGWQTARHSGSNSQSRKLASKTRNAKTKREKAKKEEKLRSNIFYAMYDDDDDDDDDEEEDEYENPFEETKSSSDEAEEEEVKEKEIKKKSKKDGDVNAMRKHETKATRLTVDPSANERKKVPEGKSKKPDADVSALNDETTAHAGAATTTKTTTTTTSAEATAAPAPQRGKKKKKRRKKKKKSRADPKSSEANAVAPDTKPTASSSSSSSAPKSPPLRGIISRTQKTLESAIEASNPKQVGEFGSKYILPPDDKTMSAIKHSLKGRTQAEVITKKLSAMDPAMRKKILGVDVDTTGDMLKGIGISPDGKHLVVQRRPKRPDKNIWSCAKCAKLMDQSLLKRCGRCRRVCYCSRECQMSHWPEHKLRCSRASLSGSGIAAALAAGTLSNDCKAIAAKKKKNKGASSSSSSSKASSAEDSFAVTLRLWLLGLSSTDATVRLETTRHVRTVLSKTEALPLVGRSMALGVIVPLLVEFLEYHHDPTLQFEAAWALTNIASSEHTNAVVDAGAIKALVKLLNADNDDLREQCCWCLGNIAGDGPTLRDRVLAVPGALDGLLYNIRRPSGLSMLQNATWALSSFCRGKPVVSLKTVQPTIAALAGLLRMKDVEVLADACWALSYISDGDNDRVAAVLGGGTTTAKSLTRLLKHENTAVVTPALVTIGNLVSGDDQQTQLVLDALALPALFDLLSHEKQRIRKDVCWALSNIAAGTPRQVATLLSYDFPKGMKQLLEATQEGCWEVRKEAAIVLLNACNGCSSRHLYLLVTQGMLQVLCALMSAEDKNVRIIALDTIEACVERIDMNDECIHHISVSGCVQRLKDFAIRKENEMDVRQKAAACLSVLHMAIERAGGMGEEAEEDEESTTAARVEDGTTAKKP